MSTLRRGAGVACAASFLLFALTAAAETSRWDALVGQQVRLLAPQPGSPWKFIGGDGSCFRDANKQSLAADKYAGRSGKIAKVEHPNDFQSWVSIELSDPAETIVMSCGGDALAFDAEMEAAKALAGKTFWAKGPMSLVAPDDVFKPRRDARTVAVHSTGEMKLTRVMWGDERQSLIACFRTGGEEACLLPPPFGTQGRYHFDDAFQQPFSKKLGDLLHATNPRSAHPKWSADTWKLIEKGSVAIGMRREQAELACGAMREIGSMLDEAGTASAIMECRDGQRFLLAGDKVVKLVR